MSGIATKKPYGDRDVQLTFPSVFQDVYSTPLQYFPEQKIVAEMPMIGDDEMAQIHLQRKRDADFMVRAKVEATRMMNVRALSGHAGYHLPDPVLSQRKFANPSNGALIQQSSRRDTGNAPYTLVSNVMSGGVLRTAQGQAYGKAKLLDRIRQLNNIASAKQAFSGLAPMTTGIAPTTALASAAPQLQSLSDTAKIELTQLLKHIDDLLYYQPPDNEAQDFADMLPEDVIEDNTTIQNFLRDKNKPRFSNIESAYKESIRAFQLIVRLASTSEGSDDLKYLQNVLDDVLGITNKLESYDDGDYNLEEISANTLNRVHTMLEFWNKMRQYLEFMIKPEVYNLQPRDKQSASKTGVKSLRMTETLRNIERNPADVDAQQRMRQGAISGSMARSWQGTYDGSSGPSSGPSSRPSSGDSVQWYANPVPGGHAARFTRTAQATAGPAGRFDPSVRDTFGYSSGQFFPTGGREVGFFGESAEPYGSIAPEASVAPASGVSNITPPQRGDIGISPELRIAPQRVGLADIVARRREQSAPTAPTAAPSAPSIALSERSRALAEIIAQNPSDTLIGLRDKLASKGFPSYSLARISQLRKALRERGAVGRGNTTGAGSGRSVKCAETGEYTIDTGKLAEGSGKKKGGVRRGKRSSKSSKSKK